MTRVKHTWTVSLQDDRGGVTDRTVAAFWDPTQEGCNEAVAQAARAEAWVAAGKQREFYALNVTNVS